jgi:hypothetical protein
MKATTLFFSVLTAAGSLVEARYIGDHIHLLNRQEPVPPTGTGVTTTPSPTWAYPTGTGTGTGAGFPTSFPTATVSVNPGDYFHSPNKRGGVKHLRARGFANLSDLPAGTGVAGPTGTGGTGTGFPRPTENSGAGWVGWQRVRTKTSEPFVPRAVMPFAGA